MGMSAIRYPLDPSGKSPDNLVEGEKHSLTPNRRVRVFCADYGAFFADSVVLVDDATGLPLKKDQYFFDELYAQPSDQFGAEIYAIVVITDPTVGDNVTMDYQCLGGPYGTPVTALIQQIEKLNIDNRPIYWGDVLGKPENGYEPCKHYHDAGDVYGMEYVVHVLERVRQAILTGDATSHDVIYGVIDKLQVELRNLIAAQEGKINEHIGRQDNPHNVSATQLNCYTRPEIDAMLSRLGDAYARHIADNKNPHNVTAHQTGAYTREEIDQFLLEIQGNIGDILNDHIADNKNPHNVTAHQTGAYTQAEIDNLISSLSSSFDSHILRLDNPHEVDKDQVGLGLVDNYATASVDDVKKGVANDKFVTPEGVKAALDVHRSSGDHDSRYVRIGQASNTSISTDSSGRIFIFSAGSWKQVYPAVWS